jgi:hypothetical protein
MLYGGMIQLATLVVVLLGSLAYAIFNNAEGTPSVISQDRGVAALSELRQWGTFLITVQTGAIAVMGFFLEKVGQIDGKMSPLIQPLPHAR